MRALRISFLTLSFVLFYPILFVHLKLRVPMAPLTIAHRLDDWCAVPAGLRSAAPVRWETERVASRISSVTTIGAAPELANIRGGFSQPVRPPPRFRILQRARLGSKNRRVPGSKSGRTSDHRSPSPVRANSRCGQARSVKRPPSISGHHSMRAGNRRTAGRRERSHPAVTTRATPHPRSAENR